jgi:predicted dithiol-disulfide oxidoreductase (DUF899 family)
MSLPKVVSPDEWRAARVALLAEEKAMTRARDALNARRRELPMVEVTKAYRFEGPDGTVALPDRPGLGVTLNQDTIDKYRIDQHRPATTQG